MMIDNSRTYWCDSCQVPVLGTKCGNCNSETRDIASSSFQPVFQDEINLLRNKFSISIPDTLKKFELWVSPSTYTYYHDGEPVFKLNGFEKQKVSVKVYNPIKKSLLEISEKKYLELIKLANLEFFQLYEYEAKNFIEKTIKKYRKKTIFVSFSGGKDSCVISRLTMDALGRSNILHLYSDTTIEFPDTYSFIQKFKNNYPLLPFVTCRSDQLDFFEIAEKIGPPSRILRWCCSTHKTNPLGNIVNVLNPTNGVLAFDGVRKAESTRRSNYQRISVDHKIGGETLARPIFNWTDFQVWLYIIIKNIPINSSYEKGFRRIGCLYCPFNSSWSEIMIKHYYKDYYQKWFDFLKRHAQTIKHKNPESYINGGWTSRAGGKGLDSYKSQLESYPCSLYDDSYYYQITSGDIKNIKEFLHPIGYQQIIQQDSESESFFIFDRKSSELLLIVELSYTDNALRIRYKANKYRRLLMQRIEKQLKKVQCCIHCGTCATICPTCAIKFTDNLFHVNEGLCTGCLKCVKHDCPSVKALHYIGV